MTFEPLLWTPKIYSENNNNNNNNTNNTNKRKRKKKLNSFIATHSQFTNCKGAAQVTDYHLQFTNCKSISIYYYRFPDLQFTNCKTYIHLYVVDSHLSSLLTAKASSQRGIIIQQLVVPSLLLTAKAKLLVKGD